MLLIIILIASPIYSADLEGRILDIGSDTTYPPHESIDPNTGEVVGFDVDVVAEICKKIYGDEVAIIPYVMPGFDLAKLASEIHDLAEEKAKSNSKELKGMVLIKHGIFSFGKTAEERDGSVVNSIRARVQKSQRFAISKNKKDNEI